MPVMDGVEACRHICQRAETTHPRATVVFVTAHVASSFEQQCDEAGGFAFLGKPITIDEIQSVLGEVLLSFDDDLVKLSRTEL